MTRSLALGLTAVCLLIFGFAVAQEKPQGTQVKGADLKKMFERPIMIDGYNHSSGMWFNQAIARGGTLLIQNMDRDGNAGQGKGKWRVEGDTFCFTSPWIVVPGGECVHVYKLTDGSYQFWIVPQGKKAHAFRIREIKK